MIELSIGLLLILIISSIVGFMVVYQGFNLHGIYCIDYLNNIVNNLNRIDVEVPVEE